MAITSQDYRDLREAARRSLEERAPECSIEIVGSFGRGEAEPPYSDLDLLIIAPEGSGPAIRDLVPEIAAACGPLLTIFVDPFCHRGTFCSVFSGPMKVDWFVSERRGGSLVPIWSGEKRPPTDPDAHPWDWLLWLWGKVRTRKLELARTELSKLWQFLVLAGASPDAFPPAVPSVLPGAGAAELERLVVQTLDRLPAQGSAVALEVARAIREDAKHEPARSRSRAAREGERRRSEGRP